jgi:hypothetical protein
MRDTASFSVFADGLMELQSLTISATLTTRETERQRGKRERERRERQRERQRQREWGSGQEEDEATRNLLRNRRVVIIRNIICDWNLEPIFGARTESKRQSERVRGFRGASEVGNESGVEAYSNHQ